MAPGAGRLPGSFGFARAVPAEAPAALVLDDVADALVAYARISARRLGEDPALSAPETVAVDLADSDLADTGVPAALARVDSAVVACTADADAARTVRALNLGAGRRLYAVVITDEWAPDGAERALERFAAACRALPVRWCGGVAVGGGRTIPRLMRSPRLGMWRRPLAEALDQLVAALRMGCSVAELADTTMAFGEAVVPRIADAPAREGGVLAVPARLPRWLYDRLYDQRSSEM